MSICSWGNTKLPNTKENLKIKAEGLAILLIDVIFDVFKRYESYANNEETNKKAQEKILKAVKVSENLVYEEILYFLLHFVNRISYPMLGENQRKIFMHSICGKVLDILIYKFPNLYKNNQKIDNFLRIFSERNELYGEFKIDTSGVKKRDEEIKGIATLFMTKLEIVIGYGWTMSNQYLVHMLASSVQFLNIPELLQEP